MNVFKASSVVAGGMLVMLGMVLVQSAVMFAGEFTTLLVGRWLYCLATSRAFSIWWPVHGAFFLTVVAVVLMLVNMLSAAEKGMESGLAKIPLKMVVAALVVFLFQFMWHGVHCFFSADEFLIVDIAWIGDMIVGVMAGVVWGVVCLVCYPFRRKG